VGALRVGHALDVLLEALAMLYVDDSRAQQIPLRGVYAHHTFANPTDPAAAPGPYRKVWSSRLGFAYQQESWRNWQATDVYAVVVPFWSLALPAGAFPAWRLARAPARRRRRRLAQGLCPACGYNLTGNVSGKCPECGAASGREPTPE